VELGSVYGPAVESNELIRTHLGGGQIDPAGAELADPIIVAELDMESLGKLCQKGIGDAGRGELNWKGADLGLLFVFDDGTSTEVGQKLVTPARSEYGAVIVDQALDDLSQRSREGVFPGDRKRPCPSDQDGVGLLDVPPTDIRVVDEVDEFELAPSYAAAIDEAALLLLERYELVPDLEEHESELGSWCCHFVL
jgi:hypothetical protein